jgi:ketosteroid isomerase-like protein
MQSNASWTPGVNPCINWAAEITQPNGRRLETQTMSKLNRREFLKHTAAGAGVLAAPLLLPSSVLGNAETPPPSERVNVGLIGRGIMGAGHLRRLVGDANFQVLAVCDVDASRREEGKSIVEAHYAAAKAGGTYKGCAAYNDYREMLARSDIDAVVIVTPDHWHALQAIDAAKAGKDIYLEKPISMTIEEGRRVVEAVQRYGRVFQTGTQYRSIPMIRQVCQFVRDGGLGKVRQAFTLLNTVGGMIGGFQKYAHVVNADKLGGSYVGLDFPLPAEPVPEGLDWELWVGPAPWRPYNHLYHRNPAPGVVPWSFSDAFGVTSSTWHLSHSADVIQYALGVENSGPVEVIHPSTGEFPTLTCKYENGTLLHFVDHWGLVKSLYKAVPNDARLAGNFGGIFVGERGWMTSMTTGGPIEGSPESLFEEMGVKSREVSHGGNTHHANWLECIRTRKRPSSDEEIGHRSASIGHLTNIAFMTGQSLKWDPVKEEFDNNDAANRLRSRATRPPWRI